jgi:hypothetical protein
MAWFIFNTGSDLSDPNSYSKISGVPACYDGAKLCAIQADEAPGGIHPILDNSIKDEILMALDSEAPTTNVRLKTI